jgi:hypothetical protein
MKARLGPKQAIVATAHKIARAFYPILKHRTPFHDLGGACLCRGASRRAAWTIQDARLPLRKTRPIADRAASCASFRNLPYSY